jgi:hypothetical protein
MFPLGGSWRGECHAAKAAGTLCGGTLCNFGYARGQCARFPGGAGPDAVRFTISSFEPGAIGIYYVAERDHLPFEHGRLEYSPLAGAVTATPASRTLARQACAYAECFLHRKEMS